MLGSFGEFYCDLDVPIVSKAVFDTVRHIGNWYEIARYPVLFVRRCVRVTAI